MPVSAVAPPRVVRLAFEAAERLGMSCRIIDSEYAYLFEVRSGSHVRHLVGGLSALNDAVACRIAQDKLYTSLVLREAGFQTPTSVRCIRPGYFRHADFGDRAGVEPGLAFAREHHFPLVVKPNRMALGRDVTVVHHDAALVRAVERAWEGDYIALVQTVAPGYDLRLDFVDGDLIAGYRRRGLVARGDGVRTLRALVCAEDHRFADDAFWAKRVQEEVWHQQVVAHGWNADTVIPQGHVIDFGATVLNLNRWATADMVEALPAIWTQYCLQIGEAMSLRHFGIDLKVRDLTSLDMLASIDPRTSVVIEVNASPSLAQTYELGFAEKAISGQMRVLQAVFASYLSGSWIPTQGPTTIINSCKTNALAP
jgi:glutathione synthase/RimK-type ligase-like ATP-grasp enzyme